MHPMQFVDPTFEDVRGISAELFCQIEETRAWLHVPILVDDHNGKHAPSSGILLDRYLTDKVEQDLIVGGEVRGRYSSGKV